MHVGSVQISTLIYEDGVLDPSSIIPLVDGGTEGFKGTARVVLPGMPACIDCTLELYPPQVPPRSLTMASSSLYQYRPSLCLCFRPPHFYRIHLSKSCLCPLNTKRTISKACGSVSVLPSSDKFPYVHYCLDAAAAGTLR